MIWANYELGDNRPLSVGLKLSHFDFFVYELTDRIKS